jgi:autotransporter-associated beta strand protein
LGANSTVGTVTMATNSSTVSTTGDAVATLNISGGTNAITTLTMGVNTSSAATGNGSNTDATLNITGGTTTVSTTFTMGAQSSAANAATTNNSAISSLNISAGSLTLAGSTNLTMGQATLDDNNLATATISITGTGVLTVGGNIQYTNAALGVESNTVTLDGGTLDMTGGNIGGAGGTGAGAGIITFNAQSGTLQNVNQINGSAGLTKTAGTGSNTLILEGTNAYTGGTTISSGILQVGGGTIGTGSTTGTLGSGDVTNNATLTINRSNSYTVSNNITGTGAVIQAGSGTTILSGTNTYTGKTTISAGKLSIDSESRLGANPGAPAADQLTFNGGTLQTTETLAIDDANRGITVNTGGGTFETATGTTTTVNSVITGGGAITKEGAGTLIFTAVNTNTGTITVNAGVLGGTGEVGGSVIVNTGTLAPGTTAEGLFTIGGNLTVNSGGTLLMQIGGTNVPNAEAAVRGFETNLATGISAGIIAGWNATSITLHDVVSVNGAAAPVINGTFKIDPTFLNSYNPMFGDVFDFLDWTAVGGITGTPTFDFGGIDLGGDLAFNTQLFASHGIIVIVPEPSRVIFLMLGLLGLMLRRRRR